jgi:hypothetical protein
MHQMDAMLFFSLSLSADPAYHTFLPRAGTPIERARVLKILSILARYWSDLFMNAGVSLVCVDIKRETRSSIKIFYHMDRTQKKATSNNSSNNNQQQQQQQTNNDTMSADNANTDATTAPPSADFFDAPTCPVSDSGAAAAAADHPEPFSSSTSPNATRKKLQVNIKKNDFLYSFFFMIVRDFLFQFFFFYSWSGSCCCCFLHRCKWA